MAKVYVNGILVTEHKGGFLPFEAEINRYLTGGKNRITVMTNNIVDETTLPVKEKILHAVPIGAQQLFSLAPANLSLGR